MQYDKKHNVLCFEQKELLALLELDAKAELLDEMRARGLSFDDLRKDRRLMVELASDVGQKTAEHRDKHEVFGAAFDLVDFYGAESLICFEMRSGFDPNKDRITTLEELNRHREGSVSDVLILSGDVTRSFQMKRYRGPLDDQAIFEFIAEKVASYGNDLGDMNLLLILQSKDNDLSLVDFSKIHEKLTELDYSFGAWIMIVHNENNRYSVINTVYPDLVVSRIPWRPASSKLDD